MALPATDSYDAEKQLRLLELLTAHHHGPSHPSDFVSKRNGRDLDRPRPRAPPVTTATWLRHSIMLPFYRTDQHSYSIARRLAQAGGTAMEMRVIRAHRDAALSAGLRLRRGRRTDGAWRSSRPGAYDRAG